MGHERRLRGAQRAPAFALAIALSCAGAAGCKEREVEEQRRELLTPAKAHQQAAKKRPGPPPLFDAQGELLASEKKIGEVVLPVGLELRNQRGNEWRFKGDRVHWEAIVRFFDKQLVAMNHQRLDGAVSFGNAALKKDPYAKQRYTVEVEQLKGSLTSSRVLVRIEQEQRPVLTPAQADAKLEEMRKNAI